MAPGARDKPQKKKGGQCCAAKQGRPAEGSAKPPRSAPASSNDFRLALPDSAKRDELFRRVDYNGNGILSLAEIDKAVLELWPQFDHKRALMRAYKAADRNGDGFIRRREFRLLLKYIIYFNDMWERFDEIDRDHDHRLTLAEFVAGCVTVGIQLTQATAAAEFSAMDENGGGYVLFDEFCHWCARRQVPVEGDAVTAEEAEMLGGAASTGAAAYDDDDYDDDDEIMVVVCPDGMTAGDMVVIETPDGREVDVEIPNGVSPGEEFEVFVGNETGNDGDGDQHDDDAHTEESGARLSVPPSAPPLPPSPASAAEATPALDLDGIKKAALKRDIEKHGGSRGNFSEPRISTRQDVLVDIRKRRQRDLTVQETLVKPQLEPAPAPPPEPEPEPEPDDQHCIAFVVPQGKGPGDILHLQLSDGSEAEICIPNGVSAGDEIEVRVAAPPEGVETPPGSDDHVSHAERAAAAKRAVEDVHQRLARVTSKSVSTKQSMDPKTVEDSSVAQQDDVTSKYGLTKPLMDDLQLVTDSSDSDQDDVAAAEALLSKTQELLKHTQERSPRDTFDRAEQGSEGMDDEEMITLAVPDGMGPGDILLVELDDGEEIEVPIPHGLSSGDDFDVLVGPPSAQDSAKEMPIDQPQRPVAAHLDEAFESAGRELRTAAQRDDMHALVSALQHADLNSTDLKTGNTALHWAAVLDHPQIVLALLDAGADSSRLNTNGATPWDLAVSKGGRKLVLQLLDGKRPTFNSDAANREEIESPEKSHQVEPEENAADSTSDGHAAATSQSLGAVARVDLDPAQVEVQPDRKAQKGKQHAAARPKRTKTAATRPPALELELPGKALRASVFRKVDTQAQGSLTADEARTAVTEIWPSFDLQSAFMPAYQAAIQDIESGCIGRKEFRRMLKYIVYFNKNWAVFEDVARKSKAPGFLSGEEFRTAANRLGFKGTRARPIAHQFIALATTRTDARGVNKGKKVGFDAFCRWCAEQQVKDDPEETDAAKATSQQAPPRSGQPVRKSGGSGGWGRAPPRFPTKPARADVLTALKQDQRPRLKKGGGVPTAQTGYAYANPTTPTKSTPVKTAPSPRTGRTRTPERAAAASPSRRGYWLHSTTGHKIPQEVGPRTTSHAAPGSYTVDHHSISRLASTKSNPARKWTKPTVSGTTAKSMALLADHVNAPSCDLLLLDAQATTGRFGAGSIYDAAVTPSSHAVAHSHGSDFDRRIQEASKSAVDCTFAA